MSLATPKKIRILQRKLYRKAKAEPAFRFYVLYDKIYREDILRHGYALARANAGAPGTDGMTFAAIEASGLNRWLAGLREELISKTYRPDPEWPKLPRPSSTLPSRHVPLRSVNVAFRVMRCISFTAQLGRAWKCRAVARVYPSLVCG